MKLSFHRVSRALMAGRAINTSITLALTLLGSASVRAQSTPFVDGQAPFLGLYCGALNGERNLDQFEFASDQLYRSKMWIEEFAEYGSWAQLEGADAVVNPGRKWQRKHPGAVYVLSVGMLPGFKKTPAEGDNLARGANGDYDFHWRILADRLIQRELGDCIIRLGWEFNGDFFPWQVQHRNGTGFPDTPDNFAEYWRKIVTAMRTTDGVTPRPGANFKFCWNGAILDNKLGGGPTFTRSIIEGCFPGREFVDFVGIDFYDSSFAAGSYPYGATDTQAQKEAKQNAAWNDNFGNQRYGYVVWRKIAEDNNLPMTLPEWGVMNRRDGSNAGHGGVDNPRFIQNMFDLIQNPINRVAWHIYFDHNTDTIDQQLTQLPAATAPGSKQFPLAAEKFQELFRANPFPVNTSIGATSPAGSSGPGVVRGSGTGYKLAVSDNFHFAARQAVASSNDMASLQILGKSLDPAAQSGLMLRQGTTANAPYAALYLSDGKCILQSRATVGAVPVIVSSVANVSSPVYLRMVRRGAQVTGHTSADGLNWVAAGSVSLSFSASPTFGVAVSSGNNASLNSTVLDNVDIRNIPTFLTDTGNALTNKTIRDNNDAGSVLVGAWNLATNRPGFLPPNFSDAGGAAVPASVFNFAPVNLAVSGLYDVYGRWPGGFFSSEDDVPIEIVSADGTAQVLGNETAGRHQWNFLGTYQFNSGTAARVAMKRLNDGAGNIGEFTFTDAVMFVPLASAAAPAPLAPVPVVSFPFETAPIADAEATVPNPATTVTGQAAISTATGFAQVGVGALSLDPAGGADTVGLSSFDLGDTFTVAAWIKPDVVGTTIQTIFSTSTAGGNADGFRFFINGFNSPNLQLRAESGNGVASAGVTSPPGLIVLGVYQHVAVSVNRTTGLARLYYNGTQVAFGTLQPNFGSNRASRIGGFSATSFPFDGAIDELRIYHTILSQPQIAALVQPPAPSQPVSSVVSLAFDTTPVTDSQPALPNPSVSLIGNAVIDTAPGVARSGSGALRLDGTTDFANLTGSPLDLGSRFTIAGWIRPNTLAGSSLRTLFSNSAGGNSTGIRFIVRTDTDGSGWLRVETANGTATQNSVAVETSQSDVVTGTYQHVAVTVDRATGETHIYLNGADQKSGLSRTDFGTAGPFRLGALNSSGSFGFDGALDDFRIFGDVLSPSQISALMQP